MSDGRDDGPQFIAPSLAGATMGQPGPVDEMPPRPNETEWMPPHFTAPRPTRRVNVNFSDQAYRTLEELAARSGKSMSDVLREAIALKAWFDRERAEGNRILVERPSGQVREVISVST